MPSVDPSDWYKEFSRVQAYIEKDIDPQGKFVEHNEQKSTKALVDISYMDELLDKIDKIAGHFQVVKEFMEGDSK